MTGKIFRSTLAASLTVLLASLLVITGCLYTYFGTVREQQLQKQHNLLQQSQVKQKHQLLLRHTGKGDQFQKLTFLGLLLQLQKHQLQRLKKLRQLQHQLLQKTK